VPKLIDHSGRRDEIARAVWRVVVRDGVSAVSIRDVAAEADLAVGSVRHVFGSKAELLQYSMARVHELAAERITRHEGESDVETWSIAMLSELLPLDEQRHIEMAVNVAVIADCPSYPGLRAVAAKAHDDVRRLCCAVVTALRGSPNSVRDYDFEVERLHALLDGLALHGLTADQKGSRARIVTVLRSHLAEISASGGAVKQVASPEPNSVARGRQ
jgi:AcrR family transcriptional regulator